MAHRATSIREKQEPNLCTLNKYSSVAVFCQDIFWCATMNFLSALDRCSELECCLQSNGYRAPGRLVFIQGSQKQRASDAGSCGRRKNGLAGDLDAKMSFKLTECKLIQGWPGQKAVRLIYPGANRS